MAAVYLYQHPLSASLPAAPLAGYPVPEWSTMAGTGEAGSHREPPLNIDTEQGRMQVTINTRPFYNQETPGTVVTIIG